MRVGRFVILCAVALLFLLPHVAAQANGDVYLVKSITFPQQYAGNTISANVVVENQRNADVATRNASLKVIIRRTNGQIFTSNGITFDGTVLTPVVFGTTVPTDVQTVPITIDPVANPQMIAGETYTFYVSMVPYTGSPPETVTSNNASSKTFTVLKPPVTIPIPDAPPWMSVVMVSIVMGWLYVSTKKNN